MSADSRDVLGEDLSDALSEARGAEARRSFRDALERHDIDALLALTTSDAVAYSPVLDSATFRFEGIGEVAQGYRLLLDEARDIEVSGELDGGELQGLSFRATTWGVRYDGFITLRITAAGQIDRAAFFINSLLGVTAFAVQGACNLVRPHSRAKWASFKGLGLALYGASRIVDAAMRRATDSGGQPRVNRGEARDQTTVRVEAQRANSSLLDALDVLSVAIQTGDVGTLTAMSSSGALIHSPTISMADRKSDGHHTYRALFAGAQDLVVKHELRGDGLQALIVTARARRESFDAVLLFELAGNGQVRRFVPFVRPLTGLAALATVEAATATPQTQPRFHLVARVCAGACYQLSRVIIRPVGRITHGSVKALAARPLIRPRMPRRPPA